MNAKTHKPIHGGHPTAPKPMSMRDLRMLETHVQQCHEIGSAMPWQLATPVLELIKEVRAHRKLQKGKPTASEPASWDGRGKYPGAF